MSNIMNPLPQYSAPPAPDSARVPGSDRPPRKSRRWVWVILSILALSSILGCTVLALGASFAIKTFGGPTIASDQYYTAIRDQDYARAYSYLGSGLQSRLSQEAFSQQAQRQDEALGRVSRYAYANVPAGDPATVILTVTRSNGTSYTVHLEMRQEGGAWKVSAFDRI